ncbi:MAG: MBL fold metallo-hydrolase [Thermoprotei archaeon]|nr:MAG: MBL fold metallo-hydrolase [Thermoprotei archaeon]
MRRWCVAALAAAALAIVILALGAKRPEEGVRPASELRCGWVERAKVTVLIDNNPNPSRPDLAVEWGISLLVRAGNATILFDAGPSPEALKHNCEALGADLSRVDFIVVSHEHWDHVGGLSYVARVRPGATVYVPSGMSPSVKAWIRALNLTVVEVSETTVVARGVAVLSPLYGPPWEQALVVNTTKGLVVLVGCSHPGVDRIAARAASELRAKPYLVLGGFHMASASEGECERVVRALLRAGVRLIAPIHCSGDTIRKVLRERYSGHYVEACVGAQVEVDG